MARSVAKRERRQIRHRSEMRLETPSRDPVVLSLCCSAPLSFNPMPNRCSLLNQHFLPLCPREHGSSNQRVRHGHKRAAGRTSKPMDTDVRFSFYRPCGNRGLLTTVHLFMYKRREWNDSLRAQSTANGTCHNDWHGHKVEVITRGDSVGGLKSSKFRPQKWERGW